MIKQQQARMGGMKAAEEPGFYASTVVRAVRTCTISTVIEKRKKPPQGISTPEARTRVAPAMQLALERESNAVHAWATHMPAAQRGRQRGG